MVTMGPALRQVCREGRVCLCVCERGGGEEGSHAALTIHNISWGEREGVVRWRCT